MLSPMEQPHIVFWNEARSGDGGPPACPFSQRAHIALVETKAEFTTKHVDLSDKPAEFVTKYRTAASDPTSTGKVPMLEVGDDFTMVESGPVVEYIAAACTEGTRLKPGDPMQESRMRLFIQCFEDGIKAGTGKMMGGTTSAETAVAALEKLVCGMMAVNTCLIKHGSEEGGEFFLGGQFSLAEVSAEPFVA